MTTPTTVAIPTIVWRLKPRCSPPPPPALPSSPVIAPRLLLRQASNLLERVDSQQAKAGLDGGGGGLAQAEARNVDHAVLAYDARFLVEAAELLTDAEEVVADDAR